MFLTQRYGCSQSENESGCGGVGETDRNEKKGVQAENVLDSNRPSTQYIGIPLHGPLMFT